MSTNSTLGQKLRTGALCLLACSAGAATAVTTASGKNGPDDSTTTGTTGTTTGTTGPPRAPLVSSIEAKSLGAGKLRIGAEVAARGAKVTSVRIRYRGVSYRATRTAATKWARTVDARGGDGKDSVVTLKVTACAGSRCVTKSGSDGA
jgi:hypothetical protein